jgi:hypothetical protein
MYYATNVPNLCKTKGKTKGRAIPVTGHRDPQSCEMSRCLHFLDNWLTDGVEVIYEKVLIKNT